MSIHELKIGTYYKLYAYGHYLIFQFNGVNNADRDRPISDYVGTMNRGNEEFVRNGTPYFTGRKCELASYIDIQWLNECRLKGKIVPRNTIKESNIEYYEIY